MQVILELRTSTAARPPFQPQNISKYQLTSLAISLNSLPVHDGDTALIDQDCTAEIAEQTLDS